MKALRIWRVVISIVAVAALVMTSLLTVVLLQVRDILKQTVVTARSALAVSESVPIEFDVAVDQAIPIRADVPINETFEVPLEFTYPLDTVVTTYIDIPVLGRQEIAIPVETVIPISYNLEVPIAMNVPISVTYQLQAEIPVQVAVPPEMLESIDELLIGLDEGLTLPLK